MSTRPSEVTSPGHVVAIAKLDPLASSGDGTAPKPDVVALMVMES